jgi:hypothetical protein
MLKAPTTAAFGACIETAGPVDALVVGPPV